MGVILVTGGEGGGTRDFAKRYAERHAKKGVYISAVPEENEETRKIIGLHDANRKEGAFRWKWVEEPLQLPEKIAGLDFLHNVYFQGHTAFVVDSLPMWLSNMLRHWEGEGDAEERCKARLKQMLAELRRFQGLIILITNEAGFRLSPGTDRERWFYETLDEMNRNIAALCEQIFLVVSGAAMEIKGREYRLE